MSPVKGQLSDAEKRLLEHVKEGNIEEAKTAVKEPGIEVDCLDENGMTPLQHAAYKANLELVELLLANGADVNNNNHDHGYSTLMFGALSGNLEVTRVLLEAGASVNQQNSVGRNAAQMAAFVGQHQVVSLINNFFSKDDLDYYTTPRGLETEPKLPPSLAPALYRLILKTNLNPVRLSLHLQQHPNLLDDSYKVAKVLDLLCEKHMKASDTNEVMAMKFHYLACLVRQTDKSRKAKEDNLESWIKGLVRGRDSDGCPVQQEMFIRSTLKEFPYAESALLQQIVQNIAKVTIGDSPSALNMLNQAINGQRFASSDDKECSACGEFKAQNKCSACKMVHYCDQRCQKLHWSTHKKFCKKLRVVYEKQEEEKRRQEEEEKRKKEQEENDKINGDNANQNEEAADENSEVGAVQQKLQESSLSEGVTGGQGDSSSPGSGDKETPVDIDMVKMEEVHGPVRPTNEGGDQPRCPFSQIPAAES